VSEFVTGKPTHDPMRRKRSILTESGFRDARDYVNIDAEPCFVKMHHPREIAKNNGVTELMILVRDPLEVCLSFLISNNRLNLENFCTKVSKNGLTSDLKTELRKYCKNVNYFIRWEGPKRIFYYEDMVNDFDSFLVDQMSQSLGIKEGRDQEFIKNYRRHKEISIRYKSLPKWMPVNTKGNDLHKFKNKLSDEAVREMKDFILSNLEGEGSLEIVGKYLE
jgi:hypothetical protein